MAIHWNKGVGGRNERKQQEIFHMMDVFISFTVLRILLVYTYVKIYQISAYMYKFIAC
jgi:hypothetical protein